MHGSVRVVNVDYFTIPTHVHGVACKEGEAVLLEA